jgi:hypothetical protein
MNDIDDVLPVVDVVKMPVERATLQHDLSPHAWSP